MKIAVVLMFVFNCFLWQATAAQVDRVFVKGGACRFKGAKVYVPDFEISKYKITNEQYAAFLNSKQIGSDGKFKGRLLIDAGSKDLQIEFIHNRWKAKQGYGQYPMVMVNYYGAVECCTWMGGRLPTEREWLYAAQGGAKSQEYRFAGSDQLTDVGWFKNNSGEAAHPVGQKKPNGLGIYDMSGNAWEWCLNENLASLNDTCILMGGSWYAGVQAAQLDARYGNVPTHFSNSVGFRVVFTPDSFVINHQFFRHYKGTPFKGQRQQLPGRLQCEWYDHGGEGIAYHDTDSSNNGSGKLNPANGTVLNEFRMHEGVDISYTKARDIDNNPFNIVEPLMDQLYAGWTVPGEWINYSIDVTIPGTYIVGLMYTAGGNGEIALMLDGKELANPIDIPSTRNARETIEWRNWHHWNKINSLVTVSLKKGRHVLTLKTISNGNMNYDYLDFKLKK